MTLKRNYIIKYKYLNIVYIFEVSAKTEKTAMKEWSKTMLKLGRAGLATLLQIKETGTSQKNIFHTHPILEDFHI